MNEDQTFEALKEILPQLEDRLRETIRVEYHQELTRVEQHYKSEMTKMEQKYQKQLAMVKQQGQYKVQSSSREQELRRQVSRLQKERAQWTAMQQHYRSVITHLTSENSGNSQQTEQDESLSQIMPLTNMQYPPNQPLFKPKQSSGTKKLYETNQSPLSDSENIHKLSNIFKAVHGPHQQEEQESLLEDRPLCTQHIPNTRLVDAETMKERGRRQDTQILSPPKSQPGPTLKQSVIQPPSQESSRATPFFNSQEGKKKLLSMIRNIK